MLYSGGIVKNPLVSARAMSFDFLLVMNSQMPMSSGVASIRGGRADVWPSSQTLSTAVSCTTRSTSHVRRLAKMLARLHTVTYTVFTLSVLAAAYPSNFLPPVKTVTVTAPPPTTTTAGECNTGNIQCCNTVQSVSHDAIVAHCRMGVLTHRPEGKLPG